MSKKTSHNIFFTDTIAANTTDFKSSPAIPNGKVAILRCFGGSSDSSGGAIAIQWGAGGSFTTIRGFFGNMNFELNRQFIGNGINFFRLVRQNKTVSVKDIAAWVEILVHDV